MPFLPIDMKPTRPAGMPTLDKRHVRRSFARAAQTYERAAVLQQEMAARLLANLEFMRLAPTRALDLGTGTGFCLRGLAQRYPHAQLYGLDLAPPLLQLARRRLSWRARLPWRRTPGFVAGDAERLPFAAASMDLIVSNATLQWCTPATVFAECLRVLRPGGLLLFSSFGPDTLQELRAAWAAVDAATHVHEFVDMHDLGDALVGAGFADPVMESERLTLTYADVPAALRDLKAIGAHNAVATRARGLTGKRRFQEFLQAYAAFARAGKIPATYEAVYGHAWAPAHAPGAPVRVPPPARPR